MARILQGTSCALACVVVDEFFVFVCAKDVQRYELSFCNELSCMDVCLKLKVLVKKYGIFEPDDDDGGGDGDKKVPGLRGGRWGTDAE